MAARHYYYAYERTDGEVCYLPKLLHEGIQRYPHTIGHYHLRQWLGVSKLLTPEQYKANTDSGVCRHICDLHSQIGPESAFAFEISAQSIGQIDKRCGNTDQKGEQCLLDTA